MGYFNFLKHISCYNAAVCSKSYVSEYTADL